MVKNKYKFILFLGVFSLFSLFNGNCGEIKQINNHSNFLSKSNKFERFADFIFKIENSEKYPYGVKSINTKGNKETARKITINSINNSFKRWEKSGKTNEFVLFFANRWCPPEADRQGNSNWVRNMKIFLAKEGIKF